MPSDDTSAHPSSGTVKPAGPAVSHDQVASAKYISAMARELQVVARRSELGLIAYFLDMILHEADLVVKGKSAGQ